MLVSICGHAELMDMEGATSIKKWKASNNLGVKVKKTTRKKEKNLHQTRQPTGLHSEGIDLP